MHAKGMKLQESRSLQFYKSKIYTYIKISRSKLSERSMTCINFLLYRVKVYISVFVRKLIFINFYKMDAPILNLRDC